MYKVDELIIYSTHGLCRIMDITEKTYNDTTKNYYVLQPLNDPRLSINIPVNSDKIHFIDIVKEDEAHKIIESFKKPIEYTLEKNFQRTDQFVSLVNQGNRGEISKIIHTLVRRKFAIEQEQKKLPIQDVKLLNFLQGILYTELALSLKKPVDQIADQIEGNILATI